jgi:hypothetical protein
MLIKALFALSMSALLMAVAMPGAALAQFPPPLGPPPALAGPPPGLGAGGPPPGPGAGGPRFGGPPAGPVAGFAGRDPAGAAPRDLAGGPPRFLHRGASIRFVTQLPVSPISGLDALRNKLYGLV